MKLGEFKVDAAKVEHGAWVDNIPEMEGLRLLVRGANNVQWRKLQRRLMDAVPRKKRIGGRLDPDEEDRITSTCLHQACLEGWEGLQNDDGTPLPYSKEVAHDLLFKPEFRRFRDGVLWAATVVGEERETEKDDIVKN